MKLSSLYLKKKKTIAPISKTWLFHVAHSQSIVVVDSSENAVENSDFQSVVYALG